MKMSIEKIDIALPDGASIETLNKILMGYLRTGADQNAVHYSKVADIIGLHKPDVSRNHKFFVAAGFLLQEKRGVLKLTNLGAKYVQSLDWGRLDDAKEYLRKILNDYELIKQVINYVDIINGTIRDDLISRIALLANVKRQGRFETGINALIDLTIFSNLLLEKGNNILFNKDIQKTEKLLDISTEYVLEEEVSKREITFPIYININITDFTDLEKLKEILKVIKETIGA